MGRYLLGLMIMTNFAAVMVSNVGGFLAPVPDATTGELPPPPRQPAEYVRSAADRWCEATGQPQGWGMFDSGAMVNSVWFEIEYRFNDGSVDVSHSVATDPIHRGFYRLPTRLDRRAVFECAFLGRELLTAPTSNRSDEWPKLMDSDYHHNRAAYDALFRAHRVPWERGLPVQYESLIIHWRPIDGGTPGAIRWTRP